MLHRYLFFLLIPFISCSYFLLGISPEFIQQGTYILCLDGGGSKTDLQVLNLKGETLNLNQNGTSYSHLQGESSNINSVGLQGIKGAFNQLFDGLSIDTIPFESMISKCVLIAGLAGLGTQEDKDQVNSLLSSLGFRAEQIYLTSDAELALDFAGNGIVLIAGTGSICLSRQDGKVQRAGGLGRIIGDEGSGYYIGMQAIKAGLEQEYGWGEETSLFEALKAHFKIKKLKTLIRPIHGGEISPKSIAKLAPLVFEEAHKQDKVATQIVQQSAISLGSLVGHVLKNMPSVPSKVYLVGGIFKTVYLESFLKEILEAPILKAQLAQHPISFENVAKDNMAFLVAKKLINGHLEDPVIKM